MKFVFLLPLFLLSACVQPGLEGLKANGQTHHVEVKKHYAALAKCLTEKFDSEPFSMMEILTPVTIYRPYEAEKRIELGHMSTVGNVYLWTMTLQAAGSNKTSVDYTARKDVNPYLASDYMETKIKGNLAACTKG